MATTASTEFAPAAVRVSDVDRAIAAGNIAGRIERLPISSWHVKARTIIGVATFFDAFDALTIAQVLPVLVPLWGLTTPQVGFMISTGYLGQLLGALFFGWLAERFGRVRAMIWAVATFALFSVFCGLASDFDMLLACRTLQGFGLGGEVPVAAVYISEIARAKGRGRFVLLYELIFSFGVVAAGLVGSYVVPSIGWRAMFFIGAFPAVIAVFLQRILPESPRWLASRGRLAEAETALSQIETATQKATGAPLLPVIETDVAPAGSGTWRSIFGPHYLRRTLVLWTIWFGSYIVYYGLSTWMPTLFRSVFKLPLQTALQYGLVMNLVGLVGAAVCALTIDYFGRRSWFTISLGGSALFLGVLWIQGAQSALQVLALASCAYFFATAGAVGLYLYTPELYPTRIRAFGAGAATAWLRLASMVGPLVIGMTIAEGLNTVFATFGVVAIVGALITFFFAVESKGRILEELSP